MSIAGFPRPALAVDTALLTLPPGKGLHVVLVKRDTGELALPGRILRPGERLSDAVLVSLAEKAGVRGRTPRQLKVMDDPDRDDRDWVVSVAHVDVVPYGDLPDVVLKPVDRLPRLWQDHPEIVRLAVAEVRRAYRAAPDPWRLLVGPFTLHELHQLHQLVGDERLKDTFRRDVLADLLPAAGVRTGSVGKPAQLYRRRISSRRGGPAPTA